MRASLSKNDPNMPEHADPEAEEQKALFVDRNNLDLGTVESPTGKCLASLKLYLCFMYHRQK